MKMKSKAFGVITATALSLSVVGGVLIAKNIDGSLFSKGFATGTHQTERSLTITAADIAAAIGDGNSGNFTVAGLNWFIAGATVTDGVVNVNGGTLYNTTLAGATKTEDNWMGTGFTDVIFKNYTVPGGGPAVHAKNGDNILKTYAPDAVAAASKVVEFTEPGGMVNRVEIAFGASGGTSFTAIEYEYTCAEYIPPAHQEIELEVSSRSFINGGQIFTYFNAPQGKTGTQIASLGLSSITLNGIDTTFIDTIVQDPTTTDFRVYSPIQNGALATSQFNIHFEFEDAINNVTYVATAYYVDGVLETPVRLSGASSAEIGAPAYQKAVMASYLSGTPTYSFVSSDTSVATVASDGALATITPLATGSTTITVTMNLGEKNYTATRVVTVTEAKVNLLKLIPGAVNSGTEYGQGTFDANEYGLWTDCSSTATATATSLTFNINKGKEYWSSQFFWADPYKSGSRQYHLTALVNASVAGYIRINNINTISLNAGDNILDVNINNLGTDSLGIFFGHLPTNTSYEGTITFNNIRITDVNSDRFDVTFNYFNGSSVVLDGCEGQKLYTKPADDSREGYEFMAWQVGGVDVDLDTYVFNSATILTARFEDSSIVTKHTVTVKDGSDTIATYQVIDGNAVDLSELNTEWANTAVYFTNAGLTDAFDTSTLITDDLTIYRSFQTNLPSTWNDYAWEYSCNRVGSDVSISFKGGLTTGYLGQINFENVPVGEEGKSYRITLSYSVDVAIPYQLCQNRNPYASYKSGSLTVGNNQTLTIDFNGHSMDSVNKLTFEVGSLSKDVHSFTIHSLHLAVVEA